MRRTAKQKALSGAVAVKNSIDGIVYGNSSMRKLHTEWKKDRLIKSFVLPHKGDGQKWSKYGARKAEVNGMLFDSVLEARFFVFLLHEIEDGRVRSFARQVSYELQPGFRYAYRKNRVLAIHYIADFVVTMSDGKEIVIDVKGRKTPEFRLKQKLFFYRFPQMKFICVQWDSRVNTWRNLDDIEADKRSRKKAKKSETK